MKDLISRQDAIDAVHKSYDVILDFKTDGKTISSSIEDILSSLPSAQPYTDEEIKKIQELEQAQFEKMYELGYQVGRMAQSERKRGKWIEDDDGWDEVIWRCSECDAVFTLIDGTPEENEYYFCPHCGADMREVSE